jgi:hypothetical protein
MEKQVDETMKMRLNSVICSGHWEEDGEGEGKEGSSGILKIDEGEIEGEGEGEEKGGGEEEGGEQREE